MEQIRSPKSVAYARLGKPQLYKSSISQQQKKVKRNSTGNIYQEIMEQYPAQTKSYIKNVVSNNKRQLEQSRQNDNPSGSNSVNNNQANSIMINSFKNEPAFSQQSFLSNLTNYLEQLTEIPNNPRPNFHNTQKLSETLKINSGEVDSFKLVAKLQQSYMKIKELKLKNYYHQKQLNKCKKKQLIMKQNLFEMLSQIKQINAQLSYQKKQRKKFEKILDSFQLRKQQHERQRKTIGKCYLRLQQFQSDLNTQSQFDQDFDSSFQEYLNNALAEKKRNHKKKKYVQQFSAMNGILDSQKIEKLFRSNHNSDESDD